MDESIRNQPDSWKKIAETYNRAGDVSKKAGIQFAYHNHNFEYAPVDGKLPYDLLLDTCDPEPGEDGNGSLLDFGRWQGSARLLPPLSRAASRSFT